MRSRILYLTAVVLRVLQTPKLLHKDEITSATVGTEGIDATDTLLDDDCKVLYSRS